MVRSFVLIIFISVSFISKGQFLDTFKVFLKSKPNISARLETRYSAMNNSLTKVTGVRVGLSFKRKLRVGIGYSWLDTEVTEQKSITDAFGVTRLTTNYFKFGYFCYYADFVFYKTKRWQLSVPIQVGTGLYWTQYNNGIQLMKTQKRLLLIYEPGISSQYKLTKWFGLGFDVCLRLALRNTNYVGNRLNSFVFAPKLLIWFDQIFFTAAPKSKLTKKFGPAYW